MKYNLSAYKNLIIVFPPGVGGHHLKELLSIHEIFTGPDSDDDFNNLLNLYNNETKKYGHCHRNVVLFPTDYVKNNIEEFNNSPKINIFCTHYGPLFWDKDVFDQLINKHFLIIGFDPSRPNSKPLDRMKLFIQAPTITPYHEILCIYTIGSISKLFDINTNDISYIDADLLFSADDFLLQEFLSEEYGLRYLGKRKQVFDQAHRIWVDRISGVSQ